MAFVQTKEKSQINQIIELANKIHRDSNSLTYFMVFDDRYRIEDIMAVQPMTAPTNLMLHMKYEYKER